jgi:acetylornithine aminotransferase
MGFHVLSRLSHQINTGHVDAYLKERLQLLPKWFPGIVKPEIRGRGLILGIGFLNEQDPGRVMSMARERGLLVLTAGKDAVRLVPSLTIGLEEVDLAMDILEGCLGALGGK